MGVTQEQSAIVFEVRMQDYIQQAALAGDFKLNADGRPLAADPGLYGDSRFFPARGHFWFGRTCNTWTAQRLRDGGVDIRTFMTLRAKSVMAQIRDHGQAGACVE